MAGTYSMKAWGKMIPGVIVTGLVLLALAVTFPGMASAARDGAGDAKI